MVLPDINVLVYAHRAEMTDHRRYLEWLTNSAHSDEAFGMADLVLAGFLRLVTNRRIFDPPSPLAEAMRFVHEIRSSPGYVKVGPGPRHWDIFTRLCVSARVKGNLVSDAYFAALAIESGCEWITTDRDFRRFPGLRWRHPLS